MTIIPAGELGTFKTLLESELQTLESELEAIGRRKPNNPEDWEAEAPTGDVQPGDYSEQADKIEGFEENTAILKELEIRYNNVRHALKKIANGSYGACEISDEPIEPERLAANPAARTCIAHKDIELT